MRLGQGLVTTQEVANYQKAAIEEIRKIAAIADNYGLSDAEREQVRASIARIESYTMPMAPATPAAAEAAGTPWWEWALVAASAFGAGALVGHAMSG